MRPGAGLYIYIYKVAGTGNRPRFPSHSCPQLHCVWQDMSATRPCSIMKFYIYTGGTHTLDKNGSLYDPAGTESWNMQIRYETTKLTMHPTNNRSSPEWFPWPRSSSKIIYRRRGFDKIIQIHRRHGFGEIIQKIRNNVGDMVSAKILR